MNDQYPGCGQPHSLTLQQLGWTDELEDAYVRYDGPYRPGRVTCRQKTVWEVLTEEGQVTAGISGAMRKLGRYPAVGDFVVLLVRPETGTTMVVDILPRKTLFSRELPGGKGPTRSSRRTWTRSSS